MSCKAGRSRSRGLASRVRRVPFLPRQQCLQRCLAVRRVVCHALRHRRDLAVADLALILQQAHVPREMVPALHRPVIPVQR